MTEIEKSLAAISQPFDVAGFGAELAELRPLTVDDFDTLEEYEAFRAAGARAMAALDACQESSQALIDLCDEIDAMPNDD